MNHHANCCTGGNVVSRSYYVTETRRLSSGQRVTDYASAPFDTPDEAKRACAAMREAEPTRALQCVEAVAYD